MVFPINSVLIIILNLFVLSRAQKKNDNDRVLRVPLYEAHKRSKGSYDFDTQRRILARLDSEGHAAFSFVLTLLTFVGALAVYTSEYPIIPCNFRVVKYVDQTIDQTYKNGIMLYDNQTESSCVVIFDHYILPDVVATKYAIRSIQSGFQKGTLHGLVLSVS